MNCLNHLGKRILIFDGGMGTLLQEKGLLPGEKPELWNIVHPELVRAVHEAYLDAGADILTANTFGANPLKYGAEGPESLEAVIAAGIRLAREAVEKSGRKEACVALDVGPSGKLLEPLGDLPFEEAVALFGRVCRAGASAGADLIVIETMNDSYEVKAALLAAKEETDLPVFVSTTYGEDGKLLTGMDPEGAVALLEGLGADAVGVNCGLGPVQMRKIAGRMLAAASVPVFVNPNAGLPRSENGRTVYDVGPGEFAMAMKAIAEDGAWLVGGCCGTTPEHIRAVKAMCAETAPVPILRKHRTVVTSYARTVEIGTRPVIIGERINPTGKKRFKEALKQQDMGYILQEGLKQEESGAHILDVNVGLPGINEAEMMERAVKELQRVLPLPLQIDTSSPEAMEAAMRCYNGKPMINSVNGTRESMEKVFPLIKKYGGVAVALLLDENGIPETAEGRLAVAEKIYRAADEYGIRREDLILDALAMTVSSEAGAAKVTLETLRRIRDELHGKSILGVSNVSFGLPNRENINAAYFTMAMQNGLSAAIINPNSREMMMAWYAYCALAGLDDQCGDYIRVNTQEEPSSWNRSRAVEPDKKERDRAILKDASAEAADAAGQKGTEELKSAIRHGLTERAGAVTKTLLQSMDALEIINSSLVPALDEVGKGFEKGRVFLPQLLMSAEAAKAAFREIRQHIEQSGTPREEKGVIVLATVKGDIHDIGKNIVKVLLENYGYRVIDLGKDVEPERVVEEAGRCGAKLVGLSALMTTTVGAMEETIRLVHRMLPGVSVIVGGAVLTESYAEEIHADAYAKDAMACVRFAEAYFSH